MNNATITERFENSPAGHGDTLPVLEINGPWCEEAVFMRWPMVQRNFAKQRAWAVRYVEREVAASRASKMRGYCTKRITDAAPLFLREVVHHAALDFAMRESSVGFC
jgi:hypothetical protein